MPVMSRLEINLRRLLSQCEVMAKEDPQKDWRLEKYINALDEMLENLEKDTSIPNKDTMAEYKRRILFLKGVTETQKLTNPVEKVVAAQLLSPGPTSTADIITKEIQQTTTSKYSKELRDQLFQSDKDDGNSLRQRKHKGEELDALLKYHHSMQEKIAEDMLSLAHSLKEQSKLANTIIKKDTEVAEKSSALTDQNFARLKVESEKLEEHSRRAWKCWIWIMIAVVTIIFINMVLFMRVMKKRTS